MKPEGNKGLIQTQGLKIVMRRNAYSIDGIIIFTTYTYTKCFMLQIDIFSN